MRIINIGFGNIVNASHVVAVISPESAPVKRLVQEAREKGKLIDATYGRRTRAVIVTASDHVSTSSVPPDTIAHRFDSGEESEQDV